MSRLLVLGADGLLGHAIVREIRSRMETWALTQEPASQEHPLATLIVPDHWVGNVDVTDSTQLSRAIHDIAPEIIVNCARRTSRAVSDPHEMWHLNARTSREVARLAAQYDAQLLHFSTDCVFAGSRGCYGELDTPSASDHYGASRRTGEPVSERCLVVRTSVIGFELIPGASLLEWALSRRGTNIDGFTRAVFSGLAAPTIARMATQLLLSDAMPIGVFHVASSPITKYDLLRKLNVALSLELDITPVSDPVVDRTLDGSAFASRTGIVTPDWDEMVQDLVASVEWYLYRADIAALGGDQSRDGG